jgi:hypothetical protein
VKSSKAQIPAKFHKIPVLCFEDQQLTSFGGLLVFQQLFNRLQFKQRLKACFAHLKLSPIFGRHLVVLLLIVHLLLGFRRLRGHLKNSIPFGTGSSKEPGVSPDLKANLPSR